MIPTFIASMLGTGNSDIAAIFTVCLAVFMAGFLTGRASHHPHSHGGTSNGARQIHSHRSS